MLWPHSGDDLMPWAAQRPCTYPGCGVRTNGSRCPKHPYEMKRTAAAKERNKLYNTARWRKRSKAHKAANPLCVDCMRAGRVTAVDVTDHTTPHKGSEQLFFDENNWQSLCHKCHNIKTATEDGGFGNC
mgnify:CR=1 FL=1